MARPGNIVKHRGYTIHKVREGCRVYAPGAANPLLVGRSTTLSSVDKCKRAVDEDIRKVAERREDRGPWYSRRQMKSHIAAKIKHRHH